MLATFKKMFGSFSCPHITKQNNFSNLQHYYLQKVLQIKVIYYITNKINDN